MSKLAKVKELWIGRDALKKELRWMVLRTRPWAWRLALLVLIELGLLAVSMACTLINKQLIDRAQPATGARMFDSSGFAVLVGLTVLSIAAGGVSSFFTTLIRERYTTGVRTEMFRSTVLSRWRDLNVRHSGDTVTRLTSDVDTVASGVSELLPDLIYLVAELVAAFVILSMYDLFLALAALALGPMCVLAGWMFSGKLKSYELRLKENNADQRAFLQESIENITVMKAFEQEPIADRRLNELREKRLKLVRQRNLFTTLVRSALGILFRGGYLLAFGWGIFQISRGNITYGTMSVFLAMVSRVQGPVMSITNLLSRFVEVLASAGRVMELEALEKEPEKQPIVLKGRVGVRLKDVYFRYGDQDVLSGVDLDLTPGSCIGLVGESGIGKTTVARLILALIAPDRGEVTFYDDSGTEQSAGRSTRSLISYVPQGNTLLSGTIRENLLTGSPAATDAEMYKALETAGADRFVRELKDGLDARIGERGIGLSEGQAQRIAIARALLRKNALLILDEATASLDTETERRIMENLRETRGDRTCLIITHRPSLLEMCDEVARL